MAVGQRGGRPVADAAALVEPARVGGLLFVAASLIAGVLTVVDPAYAHNNARVLAMSALGVMSGAIFVVMARRLPRWVVCLLPPFGALMLCFGMVLDRNIVIGGEVLLTWPLLAAYMLPYWVIICTLVTILVTFPPIALWILGAGGVTPSITMTATMVITTAVLGTLRRRNRRLVEALHRQAMTDGLTGLPNRRAFIERLEGLDPAAPAALAVIDVDHFKRINDTAGHAAGDETLRSLGELLARRVRDGELAARLGGEEFVVLFPGTSDADAARAAESLRRAVRDESQRWSHPITISVGVAARPADAVDADGLLAAADAALYRAKAAGRDCVVACDRASRLVDTPPTAA
jgi:diguanylate cyclase (GGDEF)-like protein